MIGEAVADWPMGFITLRDKDGQTIYQAPVAFVVDREDGFIWAVPAYLSPYTAGQNCMHRETARIQRNGDRFDFQGEDRDGTLVRWTGLGDQEADAGSVATYLQELDRIGSSPAKERVKWTAMLAGVT